MKTRNWIREISEQEVIYLQDQIDQLTKKNKELQEQVNLYCAIMQEQAEKELKYEN